MSIEVFGGEGEEAWYRERSAIPFERLERVVKILEERGKYFSELHDQMVAKTKEAEQRVSDALNSLMGAKSTWENETKVVEASLQAAITVYQQARLTVPSNDTMPNMQGFLQAMMGLLNLQLRHQQFAASFAHDYSTFEQHQRKVADEEKSYNQELQLELQRVINACSIVIGRMPAASGLGHVNSGNGWG